MGLRKIIKMFEEGNVCVTGLKGRGKDMLMSNVVARRKLPYVSNVDYGGERFEFDPVVLNCGGNSYKNFISKDIRFYEYPYPDGTDIYVSDAGIYFPTQYCSQLDRDYPQVCTFMAGSRHFGDCSFHFNVQNLNRVWTKIKEMSDQYIMCLGCHVIFGFVFQKVRIYDKYESCVARVKPFTVNLPLIGSGSTRYNVRLARASYEAAHGSIKTMYLFYRHKSDYDTRFLRELLFKGERGEDLCQIVQSPSKSK